MSEPEFKVRNVEAVYRIVLLGTYIVLAILSTWLLMSLRQGRGQVAGSLALCGLVVFYVVVIRWLAHQSRHRMMTYLLIIFYMLLGGSMVWTRGTHNPPGLLIFSVAIVLAGILLTVRHALLVAIMASSMLAVVQTTIAQGWYTPDMPWAGDHSSFGDVLASSVVFGMLVFISWLYHREMKRSLLLARQTEIELLQQRVELRKKIKKRTVQLRNVRLEEMQQMYRFTELGQQGVTLLHDLANQLTALTLEIEHIQGEQDSGTKERVKEIAGCLEEIVNSTRARLQGDTQKQTFNIIRKTGEVVDFLSYKAAKAKVEIDWRPPARSWKYVGDPTCFSQVITIIMSNAIDAYGTDRRSQTETNRLSISMYRDRKKIMILISDWGKGISKSQRKYLFKPFHTTKKTGLGIGLFIARQTVVINFGGTITLNPHSDHTEFIITLPVQHEK